MRDMIKGRKKMIRQVLRGSILCMVFCQLFICCAQAQMQQLKEVRVGDTLPDLLVNNIIKKQDSVTRLADLYKGGMLLIDFWATWCKPCISQMIRMDTIKQIFPRFNSISVTYQDISEVEEFFARPNNADINTNRLTIATNDTLLKQYFPHRGLPHNVWIDSSGVVKAITDGRSVTSEKIGEFLSTQELSDKDIINKEDRMDFRSFEPFRLGDTLYSYRSIITPYISGIGGGTLLNRKSGQVDRFFAWNNSIAMLYWKAFSNFKTAFNGHLIDVRLQDKSKLFHPSSDFVKENLDIFLNAIDERIEIWEMQNLYCYELVLPKPVPEHLFTEYMIHDLNRCFQFNTRIENKDMPCILIHCDPEKIHSLKSKSPDADPYIVIRAGKLIGTNIKVADLVHYLMSTWGRLKEPVVDKTAYSKSFDLELDFADLLGEEKGIGIKIEWVLEKLKEIGFTSSKEAYPYPILIIENQD